MKKYMNQKLLLMPKHVQLNNKKSYTIMEFEYNIIELNFIL